MAFSPSRRGYAPFVSVIDRTYSVRIGRVPVTTDTDVTPIGFLVRSVNKRLAVSAATVCRARSEEGPARSPSFDVDVGGTLIRVRLSTLGVDGVVG